MQLTTILAFVFFLLQPFHSFAEMTMQKNENLNLVLSKKSISSILGKNYFSEKQDKNLNHSTFEETSRYQVTITTLCRSDHRGDSPRLSLYNEINPCVGITFRTPYTFLGGDTFFETRYIRENSLYGVSRTYGVGIEWEVAKTKPILKHPLSFNLGAKRASVFYEDPGILTKRKRSLSTWGTIPFVALKWDNYTVTAEALGPDVGFYSLGIGLTLNF